MNYLKFLVVTFCFSSLGASAQIFGKPEKIARKFAAAINEGDYVKASSYCILEAKEEMDQISGRRNVDEISIETKGCKTVENEFGVDCECVSVVDGKQRLMIYSMTEVDGKWRIYDIDSERIREGEEYKYEAVRKKGKANQSTPEGSLETFAEFNLKKDYKKAASITIMRAKIAYLKIVENAPGDIPVSMSNIQCYTTRSESKTECTCDQVSADGKEETGYYELALVEGNYKIVEFGLTMGAESVVRKFVISLADGDCESAARLATAAASELVMGSIDAGCVSYHTEILRIDCAYTGDLANCECAEKRDGMEMTFMYNLEKVNGRWLVTNYQKDLGMDLGGSEAADFESVEAPVEEVEIEEYTIEDPSVVSEPIMDFAEEDPEFPGGQEAMQKFIQDHVVYPEISKANKVQGTVYVQFVVNQDGSISDVVVLKGVSPDLDAEAIRVVKLMPNWSPGKIAGKAVAVRYALPIRFVI